MLFNNSFIDVFVALFIVYNSYEPNTEGVYLGLYEIELKYSYKIPW